MRSWAEVSVVSSSGDVRHSARCLCPRRRAGRNARRQNKGVDGSTCWRCQIDASIRKKHCCMNVNRMHTFLDSRWKHLRGWSPFHAPHVFYPSACFGVLLLYGNLSAAHDGINAHACNHCRRLLIASAFLLCVVRRPLFQPMPGGLHRGAQPVLRPGALVHVNETASAGVLAALQGLPQRDDPVVESRHPHPTPTACC